MRQQVELLVDELALPILMGNLAWLRESDIWHNGAFLVLPQFGLAEQYYAKRKLVPFGEYVPKPFGFINKFVPVGDAFTPGTSAGIISLPVGERKVRVGSLVCYEDCFPALARESVQAGAQVLFVATNNAWYGEEGGASQHAAHSVLRAVENRRPVIRCGNGGWSGWIDEYGIVRENLTDADGSIYFRGGGTLTVSQYSDWERRKSYYTIKGDWLILLCSAIAASTIWMLWKSAS